MVVDQRCISSSSRILWSWDALDTIAVVGNEVFAVDVTSEFGSLSWVCTGACAVGLDLYEQVAVKSRTIQLAHGGPCSSHYLKLVA